MLQILSRWYRGSVGSPEQPYSNTSSLSISPFPEEPLALSAQEGFGFFLGRPGLLLNEGRYEVLRKLGKGKFSSTWLACDSQAEERLRYCAIKILTVYATKGHYDHNLIELEIMQTITSSIKTPYLPRLWDRFETEGPHGRHLCLVLPVLSDTVSNFRRSAPSKSLDPPKVKILIAQIVEALVGLHGANIIHTDIKADNMLFNEGTDTQTLDALLDQNPPIVDGEFELNGVNYPIMRSQPIPHPFLWNDPGIVVETYPVCLTDFGSAQWVYGERPTRTISAPALRAPEVILGADYGTKVDIWAIGCMTFELLTGRWLFKPTRGQTWRVEDDHLAKMMELTGETFGDKTLATSRKRDEYFDKEGKLLRIGELFPRTLEQVMINYGLPEPDAASAAVFIRACLQLNAEERLTAMDLLSHPWLETAYFCS